MQRQISRIQKLITFSPQLYALVKQKAERLGLSFPEYLRMLAAGDVKKEIESIVLVDEETEKRIEKSLEEYKKGKFTTLKTDKDIEKHFRNL